MAAPLDANAVMCFQWFVAFVYDILAIVIVGNNTIIFLLKYHANKKLACQAIF